MQIAIAFISILAGIIIGLIIHPKPHTLGDLRIDQSDPTCAPLLFLELGTDVRTIMQRKHATFRVKVENFIPHE